IIFIPSTGLKPCDSPPPASGSHEQPPLHSRAPAHLICRVCRGVYREPRVNQCGHTLCSGCYTRLQFDPADPQPSVCPQCGSGLVPESSVPNRDISEEVEELTVHCIYHFKLTPSQQAQAQFLPTSLDLTADPNGCNAELSLLDLEQHISSCEFRPAPCPFDTVNCRGCSHRDLQRHAQDCIFRFLELAPREILDGLSVRQSETLATLASLEQQLRSVESRLTSQLDCLDAALDSAASAVAQTAPAAAPTAAASDAKPSLMAAPPVPPVAATAASAISAPSRATSRTASTRSAVSAVAAANAASASTAADGFNVRSRRSVDVFDFGGGGGEVVEGGGAVAVAAAARGALSRSPSMPVGTARLNGLPANPRSSYLTCLADLTWHSSRVVSLLLIPEQFRLVSLDSTGAIVAWNIQQLCSGHAGNARAVERLGDAQYSDSFVCACRLPVYVFVGCRDGSLLQLARFATDIKRVKTEPGAHSACITAVWKSSNLCYLQTVAITPRQSVRCLTFDACRGALLCACETELHRFLVRQQPPQQPPLQQDLPAWHQRYRHQLLTDITCLTVTEERILNGSLQIWRLLDSRHRSLGGAELHSDPVEGAVLLQQTERHRDSVTSISLLQDLLFTGSGDGWMKVFRFQP
uniref:RING-type domain-containing protein n=1 Tax=Macrostomum lignano TaxID=282301 RepID=A0A1I8HMJ1_9PLAT